MKGIAIVSHSKDPGLTFHTLQLISDALTRQLCDDYASVWQTQGVPVTAYEKEADAPLDYARVIIFDTASDPGILGYHDVTPSGVPYGKIFWGAIHDSGGTAFTGDNSLSVTLSHECLELIEDPYANAWNDMGDSAGTEDAHELCDRVEGDSYSIYDISVSNFLGPRAFRNGDGPYDFLGIQKDPRALKSPFETRPTGYAIRRTGGPNGNTQSIFGEKYPEHKKAMKLAVGSKAHKRGVVATCGDLGIRLV